MVGVATGATVIAVDTSIAALRKAKDLGAAHTVDARQGVIQRALH
eukprot:SAG31_NODE_393_length_16293_cov_15.804372_8_plen_45_part_00